MGHSLALRVIHWHCIHWPCGSFTPALALGSFTDTAGVTGTVGHSLALWVCGVIHSSQTLWVIHWHCGSFTVGHSGTPGHSLALRDIHRNFSHWHCGSFTGTVGHLLALRVIHWHCGTFTGTAGHSLALRVTHRHCGSFTGTVGHSLAL